MKEEIEKVSTKSCPKCGTTNLLQFTTLNLKSCPDCFLDIPWFKEKNQLDLYCCSPNTDKDYA
jgi:hypothetical protein